MYDSFYGLSKRPFAAAADVDATVHMPGFTDAVVRLDRCIRQGRGIGVLTATSGAGKTHLCHHLVKLWQPEFQVTLLPNAGFPSGRGLLQAMLAELEQPYQGLRETELRIELKTVAKAVRSQSAGLVLVLDEAHRAADRLLEEIRLLANLIDSGEPLVRVLLAGSMALEDKLSNPELAGLNERVGELVTLPRLTAAEARHYLTERSAHAGGTLEELFESSAIELIIQACGGVPRCLNQLADHALLLGSVAGRTTVDATLTREALEDLKRLPFQWQDPLPMRPTEPVDGGSFDFGTDDECLENVIEIGELSVGSESDDDAATGEQVIVPAVDESSPSLPGRIDCHSDWAKCDRPVPGHAIDETDLPASEPIHDRFASLDAYESHRRWLEELDRKEAGQSGEVSVSEATEVDSGPPADPLPVLNAAESLVASELANDWETPAKSGDVAGRVQLDRLVSVLGAAADRSPSNTVDSRRSGPPEPHHATLFRDLRHRSRVADDC